MTPEASPWRMWRDDRALLDAATELLTICDQHLPDGQPFNEHGLTERMEAWVNDWGLLGVGLFGLVRVTTWPRVELDRTRDGPRAPVAAPMGDVTTWPRAMPDVWIDHPVRSIGGAAQNDYTLNGIWQGVRKTSRFDVDGQADGAAINGENGAPLTSRRWAPVGAQYRWQGGAVSVPLGALEWMLPGVVAKRDAWGMANPLHIPGLGLVPQSAPGFVDQYEVPLPTTPEWWSVYGETASTMLLGKSVKGADGTVVHLPGAQHLWTMVDCLKSKDDRARQLGGSMASGLMLDVHPVATVDGMRIVTGTLLGALARVLFDNVTGGDTVARCERCGRYFVAPRKTSRGCSDRCTGTLRQRQRRSGGDVKVILDAWRANKRISNRLKRIAATARDAGYGTNTKWVKTVLEQNGYSQTASTSAR